MIAISSAEDFHAAVAVSTEKPLVACFSAPWCGGCKLVAPKVAKLAEELDATVSFAKVSAEELETLCEEVEVDSFPHFRVYKDGKVLGDYTSSKFDKVDAFIRGLVAPDTVEKTEETPEDDEVQETTEKEEVAAKEAAEETSTEVETEGSKKRQEREEMEANDDGVAKKAKTEEATEENEKVESVVAVPESVEEVKAAATEQSEKEVAAPADKLETSEATEAGAEPTDKLEVSEAAEAGAALAEAAAA